MKTGPLEPKVSVIIPSYNHARFLDQALASVLDNALPIEVIAIDDGSADESLKVLNARAQIEKRLRVFSQANAGAHATLNRGLDLAAGEIVTILNSDDFYEADRLELLLETFAARPTLTALATTLNVIDTTGKHLAVKEAWRNLPPWPKPRPGPGLADLNDPILALLETNYLATTSNLAFRRAHLGGLRFLDLRYAHDWDFFLGLMALGDFALVERPLVNYRVHPENTLREGQDIGRGTMRFEIMWLVARHAARICRLAATRGFDPVDLEARQWTSLPRFGRETLLLQLLAWRGHEDQPPPGFDTLIERDHPFRRRAIACLSEE